MIQLGCRTDYSFMRGYGSPAQWRAAAEQSSVTALAVTDYCSTWGHAAFEQEFAKSKVKLLYGVQVPVCTVLDKDPRHDLVSLIARDPDGLQAIYKAMTVAEAQTYYRPRLTWQQLEELAALVNIIANDVSLGSLSNMQRVKGILVGVRPVRDNMLRIAKTGDFPVVPAAIPCFPATGDRVLFELMQKIGSTHQIGEIEIEPLPLLRKVDYEALMKPLGVEASWDLAERLAEESFPLPKASKIKIAKSKAFGITEVETACIAGAARLGIDLKAGSPYAVRLARELKVIEEKDFADYFLFVGDLVAWARDRMFVGPARGSSAGCLICYLMGITTVDPLKYDTLFERFIDITRPDWPDIDVDFPDDRRDEVLAYMRDKYGEDHFARLGTISEFGGKSAINDTAKATGVSYDVARELGKIIEGYIQAGMQTQSLEEIFKTHEQAVELVGKYPTLNLATQLEGHIRHHGVHAAGVVVSNEPITTFGALNKQGTICFDMKQAERLGLIKMDALGLRTLSVIQSVCDLAGIKPATLYDLDFLGGDQKVWDLFNNDRVTGIFQFEGQTVRQLMKGIRVEKFDDLAALTALARPGPLIGGAAEMWGRRRSGNEEWQHRHEALKPHLESTFGAIVYQEQAMKIVRDLGGFGEPDVNAFRRAVGKKDPAALAGFRDKFLAGCAARTDDVTEDLANEIWDEMCEFGSYAFNLSHSVAYSMISYIAAHLKAYHPLEFAIGTLRNASSEDQAKQILRELSEEGYSYVPFDPHKSQDSWSVIDGKLYGGFDSVKGIGSKTAATLLAARNADPENWLDKLTDSQRDRILSPNNTPWHSLSYFQNRYRKLYSDPDNWRSKNLPAGVNPPVYLIKDIPAHKGIYKFLGRVVKKMVKDANAPEKVAKRGGQAYTENTQFVNLIWGDDTGEIGTTISRFKVADYAWLLDSATDGRDFIVKGKIIGDGRWLFVENIVEIENDAEEDRPVAGTRRKAQRRSRKADGSSAVHKADD